MNTILYKRSLYIGVLLFGLFFSRNATAQLQPALADSFLNFIKSNKARSSVYITKNDTVVAFLNENMFMPLASTFKILVAVEFAKQASSGIIDKNGYIPLSELDKYYLPNTDGNAHPSWIDYERKNNHVKKDSVRLIDIARGMIMFSSNANAEYLMDTLGWGNVNSNIKLFGLRVHSSIYPPVASLLMFQNPKNKKEKDILKDVNSFSELKYARQAYLLHLQLKHSSIFKASFRPEDLTMKMQKAWSDRLPSSTTKDYVHLANILNNRKFLPDTAYRLIEQVLEFPMENKAFQAVFKHYGVKGGNTSFVLTHVIYLRTKSNNNIELAIFFNDLSPEEEKKLATWLDPFEAQVIFDGAFRAKLRF